MMRRACLPLLLLSMGCSAEVGDGPDSGGSGGSGGQAPSPTAATLQLANESSAPLTVHTGDCNGAPQWFRIRHDGEPVAVFGACITDCETFDPEQGPVGCAAICMSDTYEVIPPGESMSYEWDGAGWEPDPRGCSNRVPVPPGETLSIELCWVPGDHDPGEHGTEPPPGNTTCETVTAVHGEHEIVRFEVTDD